MNKKYFYTINYPVYEKDLCNMEMKYLFNCIPKDRYFFSCNDIEPSISPFIKDRIDILYVEENLSDIVNKVVNEGLSYQNFKICFIKLEDTDLDYKERLESIRKIGLVINGQSEMHNPDITLALTKVDGKWIFGEYQRNDYLWHIHDNKPCTYSNSIGIRSARAIVNIAAQNDKNRKIVDPCCGVGTLVIEGLSMDINIKGYEIKKTIAANARRNLEFFGFDKDKIKCGDIHQIKEKYDVAIIDLPYGLFTPVTPEEQAKIIMSAAKISEKLVLVSFEDMSEQIENAGFKIVDRCKVSKGKFTRNIDICYK